MTEQPVKLDLAIRPFDGQGDFAEWLERLEHVVAMQAIAEPARFLPLFLSGGAFSVYQTLAEEDKKDYGKVRKALLQAFAVDSFRAYEQLMARKLRVDEHVDVYVSAVKRLVSLVRGEPDEVLAKHAFVAGLPDDVRHQLHTACLLTDMSFAAVVAKARMLVDHSSSTTFAAAAAARSSCTREYMQNGEMRESRPARGSRPASGHAARSWKNRRVCFVCGADTHLAAACPDRKGPTGPKNE